MEWEWMFVPLIIAVFAWTQAKDRDRCFEAAKAHVDRKDCKP